MGNESRIELHSHPLKITLEPDGVLTLEGSLPTVAAKKLALRAAASVPGVGSIADRLRITPARQMSDPEIRNHVRNALLEEPTLDRCEIRTREGDYWRVSRETAAHSVGRIDVSIDDGVATLNGQVESLSQQRLSGVLAWWVPATRDVINGLEVVPPQEDSDDEITEAVKLVLAKDPLVNGERVRVRTRDAVVTLEGLAANKAEAEMIETDAWCVLGVEQVVSRLEYAG